MEVHCPQCRYPFSTQQQIRYPHVLPCGHSICSSCIRVNMKPWNTYFCSQCSQTINFDNAPIIPINYLFFQMNEKMQNFMRNREWDSGRGEQNVSYRPMLKLEQQCLYTFCQRKKFQKDGVVELFCSKQCKLNHQELEKQI